ncbi:radical SAM family heme chaperone HemW [Hyphococcus luteus]|uniref:Heme chaperone HemW n=1 Tax=Hyphococcus luteus TaxID=2058213 RepID=A0A2S7K7G0_9PROT|nr:radical SAM family heme chaperone HemW [Marinicaulis flavus]PQA88422.1 coproporphyrinogen III oxidase [Marinicaulis flavus]
MTAPLGVYVHWPYCARICPYCDFNVYKNRPVDAGAWGQALTRDLEHYAKRTQGRKLQSLYFGGGTPSLAPIPVIESVIEVCARLWGFEDGAEITLEANPTDAEQSRFEAFAGAGVNRLSLGVQSLRDGALQFLGRDHDAAAAIRAIEAAQKAFPRVTFDLIYARPGQSLDHWRAELAEALALGASHLSLYQLTIEPGTAFDVAVDKGRWAPAGDDLCADMFDAAQEMTAAAGLPAYEISNHAAPGEESRHNLIYWTYGDYVGAGPGAHGRLTENGARIAVETPLSPKDYLAGAPHEETALSPREAEMERLSMGLRLHKGVAFAETDAFFAEAGAYEKLDRLVGDGLLHWDGRTLCAAADGRRLLNRVLYELFG